MAAHTHSPPHGAMQPSISPPNPRSPEKSNPITALLASTPFIILDGALATELEARGCDIADPLWSCKALLEQPELIEQVHCDYYRAGAHVAITASYQASVRGLRERRGMPEAEALELIGRSVTLAQSAAREAAAGAEGSATGPQQQRLVAGSVGPYGAYLADGSEYRGDYKVGAAELAEFHRPRIQALIDRGVDVLACETLPSKLEVQILSDLLQTEFPGVWAWFAFTLRDAHHLSDGTPLAEVCAVLAANPQVVAVGVNCIPPLLAGPALRHMSALVRVPLVVYPNSGEVWDATAKKWINDPDATSGWPGLVAEWRDAGARLIGGCCKTSPADIQMIQSLV